MHAIPMFRRPLTVLVSAAALLLAACSGDTKSVVEPDLRGPVFAIGVDNATGASIETSKDDYVPGEIVHLMLKGWAANEQVRLIMTEAPDTHGDVDTTVTVDASGEWSGHFYDVREHDLGVTFTLTGTGNVSNSVVSVVFYDGAISNAAISLKDATCTSALTTPVSISSGTTLCASAGFTVSGGGATKSQFRWIRPAGTIAEIAQTADFANGDEGAGKTRSDTYVPTSSGVWTVLLCEGDNVDATLTGCQSGRERSRATFTVTVANGSITIITDAIPNSAQDFAFTTTGNGLSSFSLDDDADPTLPNTQVFSNLASGAYTVTESGPTAGWDLTALSCTGGGASTNLATRTASISLAAGSNVICTYTNTRLGTITISKDAAPNSAQDFGFTTTGTGLSSFSLDDDADPALSNTRVFSNLAPGSYTVTESGLTGWELTALSCTGDGANASTDLATRTASIGLDAGENIICTYTNTQAGTITVIKEAVPTSAQDFGFTTTGSGLSSFSLDDDGDATLSNTKVFSNLAPGSYTVTESGQAGWDLTALSCTGGGANVSTELATRTASIGLDAGENITCTYTNTNRPPVLASIANLSNHPEETKAHFTASATDTDPVSYELAACAVGTYPNGAAIGATSGLFEWTPAENQGAADYCVKVVATAIGGSDNQEVSIGVTEVNRSPILTVPTSFSIKWGTALSGVSASATDPDLSAPTPGSALNNLSFSLTTNPTGMSIGGTAGKSPHSATISWTPTNAQVGANSVTVKVTDDGSPAEDDEGSFTITVLAHATTLLYDGATSGQYSDVSQLCATLTDNDASNAGIAGKTISFSWNSVAVGAGTTNGNGRACTALESNVYTVADPNGSKTVKAVFAGDAQYGAATDDGNTFDVDAEDASVTPDAGNQNAYQVAAPGGASTFSLKFTVMEKYGPEPYTSDKALAGDIANAVLNVSLIPVGGGSAVNPSTCATVTGGSGYGSTKTFTCSFSGVPVETYEVKSDLNGTYYAGSYSDVVTVFDPSLGFATGGGTYLMDGDRVNFGFVGKVVQNKKNSVIKGSLLVIRHKPNGDIARIKSNVFDGLAIGTNTNAGTATFSGKANYMTVVGGITQADPVNYDFTAYVKDGGTPGAGVDQFSLYHGKGVDSPSPYAVRTSASLAALKSTPGVKTLTGGNIQVPQPQGR